MCRCQYVYPPPSVRLATKTPKRVNGAKRRNNAQHTKPKRRLTGSTHAWGAGDTTPRGGSRQMLLVLRTLSSSPLVMVGFWPPLRPACHRLSLGEWEPIISTCMAPISYFLHHLQIVFRFCSVACERVHKQRRSCCCLIIFVLIFPFAPVWSNAVHLISSPRSVLICL